MNVPFDELSVDMEVAGDCGCGGSGDVTFAAEGDALASPEEMESALQEYVSAGTPADTELDLALDDEMLLAEDELALPDVGDASEIELKNLIALAEQHPGLNISISFG